MADLLISCYYLLDKYFLYSRQQNMQIISSTVERWFNQIYYPLCIAKVRD